MISEPSTSVAPLLDVRNLSVIYRSRLGRSETVAVNNVSFTIEPGETLGLVGESGSGKSTLGRAILRLVPISAGEIRVVGHEYGPARRVPLSYRRDVQVVWQDPFSSLNPTMRIGDVLAEPLRIHGGLGRTERRERAAELLRGVGLSDSHLDSRAHEFSGGQRQRIAIARALAVEPRLIVLDEPVSALDVSTQSQIIGLLEEIQERTGVSYLFIGHDIAVVRHISRRIAVLKQGEIVEMGDADTVCDAPQHEYTRALIAAIPRLEPRGAATGRTTNHHS